MKSTVYDADGCREWAHSETEEVRDKENNSFSDSARRHASLGCRSFARLSSSALRNGEGTVAKVGAVTQLIRRFWLLRHRRCDLSVRVVICLRCCSGRGRGDEGERREKQ